MKPAECEQFVRSHTVQFEMELQKKLKKTVSFPSRSFEKTAAINLQGRNNFDQDAVIQQKAEDLGNYIIEVITIQRKKKRS